MASETGTEQDTRAVGGTAELAAGEAKSAAGEVAGTAKDQTRRVVEDARTQVRELGGTVRDRVRDEGDARARQVAQSVRGWSEELESMAEGRTSAPGRLVREVATRGHRAADYVDEHGLGGLLSQVETFARRRPGLFLLGTAAAGFAFARLAKASREEGRRPRHHQVGADAGTNPASLAGAGR